MLTRMPRILIHMARSPGWGGGGDSHMKQIGILVGNLNLTPKGDHLGVAQAFCDP